MPSSKSYINKGLIEGIEVVFENCESVYIPQRFIHKLDVRSVVRNIAIYGSMDSSMVDLQVSRYVNLVVQEYGDTVDIVKRSQLFSSEHEPYDGYGRLGRVEDITSIIYYHVNGKKEQLYVDYSDGETFDAPNEYQRNKPVFTKEVPRGLSIQVASPRTLQDLKPEKSMTSKDDITVEEVVVNDYALDEKEGIKVTGTIKLNNPTNDKEMETEDGYALSKEGFDLLKEEYEESLEEMAEKATKQ